MRQRRGLTVQQNHLIEQMHRMEMDAQIEQEQGCSISDIFAYGGEKCFRQLETELLERLSSRSHTGTDAWRQSGI